MKPRGIRPSQVPANPTVTRPYVVPLDYQKLVPSGMPGTAQSPRITLKQPGYVTIGKVQAEPTPRR